MKTVLRYLPIATLSIFLAVVPTGTDARTRILHEPQTTDQELQAFSKFFKEFQSAVRANDKKRVANMTLFPLVGGGFVIGNENESITREEFLKHYRQVFDARARQAFNRAKPETLDTTHFVRNSWTTSPLPDGTTIYYVAVSHSSGHEAGEEWGILYGFAKIDGEYKFATMVLTA